MIDIFVIDTSAESRTRITNLIEQFLRSDPSSWDFVPHLNLRPIGPEELSFHGEPHICVIGDELVSREITQISNIKKAFPSAALIARLTTNLESLSVVEHLARLGIDDVFSENISAHEFLRKIILLSRQNKTSHGRLILVDSGKGGLGVTSTVAALGELIVDAGKSAVLIDLDFDTQDLSRFLQTRPFINENLALILSKSRPLVQESVEQCVTQVWADEPRLCVMQPAPELDDSHNSANTASRLFLSVLEILDAIYDYVVVDTGNARNGLRKMLYRISDTTVFVVSNDPAALYASADRLSKIYGESPGNCDIKILPNGPLPHALPFNVLRSELSRATGIERENILSPLPLSKTGSLWPGSGSTLYTHAKGNYRYAMEELAVQIGIIPKVRKTSIVSRIINRAARKSSGADENLTAIGHKPQIALPEPSCVTKETKEIGEQTDDLISPATLLSGAKLY